MNHPRSERTLETRLPEALVKQAEALVEEGWSMSLDALIAEALRRYLDTHQTQLAERFVREDVTWGLKGDE